VEMDGTLIPIVEAPDAVDENGNPVDRRTTCSTRFKESRLVLARRVPNQSLVPPWYPRRCWRLFTDCAIAAGMGAITQVHMVGDGVLGLPTLSMQFGDSATYLLDFYHLSEYLASASVVCVSST